MSDPNQKKLLHLKSELTYTLNEINKLTDQINELQKCVINLNETAIKTEKEIDLMECRITQFYKITNAEEKHYNHQYTDGRNVLSDKFESDPQRSCCSGGLYITTGKYIMGFLQYGVNLRLVTLPFDDPAFRILKDKTGDKWRCNMLDFASGSKHSLNDLSTFQLMAKNGCNFNTGNVLNWVIADPKRKPIALYLVENELYDPIGINYGLIGELTMEENWDILFMMLNKLNKCPSFENQKIYYVIDEAMTDRNKNTQILKKLVNKLFTEHSDKFTLDGFLAFVLDKKRDDILRKYLVMYPDQQFDSSQSNLIKQIVQYEFQSSSSVNMDLIKRIIKYDINIFDNTDPSDFFYGLIFTAANKEILDYVLNQPPGIISSSILNKLSLQSLKCDPNQCLDIVTKIPISDINFPSLISECIKQNRHVTAKKLIELIPAATDCDKTGLLVLACRNGDVDFVPKLLAAGANMEVFMNITLRQVYDTHDQALIDYVLQYLRSTHNGIKSNLVDFAYGAFVKNNAILEKFLHLITECNPVPPALSQFSSQLLMKIVPSGNLSMVELLVRKGANIHELNEFALRSAAEHGHLPIVHFLINNGADVNAYNGHAICLGVYHQRANVVKYLIEHGANVHTDNECPLQWAIDKNNFELVQILTEAGANINDPSIKSKTMTAVLAIRDTIKNYLKDAQQKRT